MSRKLTDKGPFFTDMVNSADGKNIIYIEEITDSFVTTIIKEKPEIFTISGDLTFTRTIDFRARIITLDIDRNII